MRLRTEDAFVFVRDSVDVTDATGIGSIARNGTGTSYLVTLETGPAIADGEAAVTVAIYLQPNSLMSLTTGEASHDGAVVKNSVYPCGSCRC